MTPPDGVSQRGRSRPSTLSRVFTIYQRFLSPDSMIISIRACYGTQGPP